MKKVLSVILLCLLLTGAALPALAQDQDPALSWMCIPGEGETTVAFHIDTLGTYFYHVWITRGGSILGYYNAGGGSVPFTSQDNTFDLINDTDVFVKKGFMGFLPGDLVKVRVGSSANVIAHTLPTEAPQIKSFTIPGQVSSTVGDDAVLVTMPAGTSVQALTPTIVFAGASITPGSGVGVDFTSPVSYVLTASDGSTYTYTVTVKVQGNVGGSSNDEFIPKEPTPVYEQAIVVGVKEWANVRSGPSTDAEIIGRVGLGERIFLNRWNADESWCEVYYADDTKIGWLHVQFIRPLH